MMSVTAPYYKKHSLNCFRLVQMEENSHLLCRHCVCAMMGIKKIFQYHSDEEFLLISWESLTTDSYSPDIDVGQIEGGIVMGLGVLLKEQTKYDQGTGQLLTHNTWVCIPLHHVV